MRATDESTSENISQRAAIEIALPPGRFEWVVEGWFKALVLDFEPKESIYVIHLLSGSNLSVAARIQNVQGSLKAGLVAREHNGDLKHRRPALIIKTGVWRKWRLHLLA